MALDHVGRGEPRPVQRRLRERQHCAAERDDIGRQDRRSERVRSWRSGLQRQQVVARDGVYADDR